jgi:hypothetical protein
MRFLIAIVLSLIAPQALAQLYGFATASVEHLRYDIDKRLDDKLAQGNTQQYLDALELAGGTFEQRRHLTTSSFKVGIGYQLFSHTAVELHARRYGQLSVHAFGQLDKSLDPVTIEVRDHTLTVSASAYVEAYAMAGVKARGTGLSLVTTITGPWFVRYGVEHIVAELPQSERYTWGYQYDVTLDGKRYTGAEAGGDGTFRSSRREATVPLVGIGGKWDLDRNWAVRVEFEHVGVISKGVDFYSLSVLYNF